MTITMRQMLEAGVHFGHQTRYWNPKMAPCIFGERNGIHIINLEETLPKFLEALSFVKKLAEKRGKVLFVGTKRQARDIVRQEAERAGMPFVNHRWLGGMLTNFQTVRQSVKNLIELESLAESGQIDRLPTKESQDKKRMLFKLERNLGGVKDMTALPDALFVIDVGYDRGAILEANKLGIPVIGVVDTNNDPHGVDYLIPGNDDSSRAITLYCEAMADAILEGRAKAEENLVVMTHSDEELLEEIEQAFYEEEK